MNTLIYKDMKMKTSMIGRVKNVALGITLVLLSMSNIVSAEDDAVSIFPTQVLFPDDTAIGEQSAAATITLTNSGYAGGMTVGSITLDGPHSANFNVSNDNCKDHSLAVNTSCTLQVNFAPKSSGIKGALLTIPYGTDDGNLSVYLTNHEDAAHEVQRRLSPVMYALNIPEEMNASSAYDINWTAMGYHSGYTAIAVMFDCTGIAAGECGASYGSPGRFHESAFLSPAQITEGDWTYNGETVQNFRYDYTFNVDAKRPNGEDWDAAGTPIVIRFYIRSDDDTAAGKPSLSLIIPGNLSNDYYDTSGRKIQKIICPAGGCTP